MNKPNGIGSTVSKTSLLWPLVVLLVIDVVGLWAMISRFVDGSWDARIEIALIGIGLLILQLPFLLRGLFASWEAQSRRVARVYVVHAVFTLSICVVANSDIRRWLINLLAGQ
jgi:hypothetical protein